MNHTTDYLQTAFYIIKNVLMVHINTVTLGLPGIKYCIFMSMPSQTIKIIFVYSKAMFNMVYLDSKFIIVTSLNMVNEVNNIYMVFKVKMVKVVNRQSKEP